MKKLATLILALVLVSATALAFTGCDIMVVGYEVSYARGNEAATGEVPAAKSIRRAQRLRLRKTPLRLKITFSAVGATAKRLMPRERNTPFRLVR